MVELSNSPLRDEVVHIFPKGIRQKVKEGLTFELGLFNTVVQYVDNNITEKSSEFVSYWFGLVSLYGISTLAGYLWSNQYIYDFVWFDFVLWHINHCWLFNAKSSLYIYIKYI